MLSKETLCVAPFNSAVIDTNRGIRPCCTWDDKYFGNLKDDSVESFRNSEAWKALQKNLADGHWPKGCLVCKEQERTSNWSLRHLFLPNVGMFSKVGTSSNSITYLEFAGSNLCNLACLHCSPGFSSKWVSDYQKLIKLDPSHPDTEQVSDEQYRSYKSHPPNVKEIEGSVLEMDLSQLTYVNFKGGEPLLNPETEVILEELRKKDILKNISIVISTNGTVKNSKFFELAQQAKDLLINISVDGLDELNSYIRFGNSHTDVIEEFISSIKHHPNTTISRSTSVMAYNIHDLLPLRTWWNNLAKNNSMMALNPQFNSIVMSPQWLNPSVLSDSYRNKVSESLTKNQLGHEFAPVISALKQPYAGNELHNRFIKYTESMEKIRKNSLIEVASILNTELKYL